MPHIYENCVPCPFHHCNGIENICKVKKCVITKKGVMPIPPSSCIHSKEFNENFINKNVSNH